MPTSVSPDLPFSTPSGGIVFTVTPPLVTSSRTVPTAAALLTPRTRTVPLTASLQRAGTPSTFTRTVPAAVALLTSGTRTVSATAALQAAGTPFTLSRTVPAAAALFVTVVTPPPVFTPVPVPTVTCWLALATLPTQTPVWTDVTTWLQAFSLQRGRQSELDTPQAGTASIVLDNRDRRFDPLYPAGPYYGTLKPMRRGKLQVNWGGATYDAIHFYIQRWPQTWPGYEDAVVTLQGVDAMGVLARFEANATFPQQLSGQRLGALLDAVAWQTGTGAVIGTSRVGVDAVLGPVSDRNIAAGDSTLQAVTLQNTNAMQHAQDVERSEDGLFFVSRDGAITFHNRHRRQATGTRTPFAVFGEESASGELLYKDLVVEYDDQRLYNDVRVTRTGGAAQTAGDPSSQGEYFKRTLSRDTLITTDTEALATAQGLLNRYKQPRARITDLTLSGYEPSAQVWTQLFTRDLGDCVQVRKRPHAGGAAIDQLSWIEGIRLAWSAEGGWDDAHWSLSPADQAAGGAVGSARVGVDAVLTY